MNDKQRLNKRIFNWSIAVVIVWFIIALSIAIFGVYKITNL